MSQEIKTIKLKPFSPTEDLEILEKWLNLPHVSQWWVNPKIHWQAALNHPSHEHGIIMADGIKVGYLRWQKVDPAELKTVGITTIPDGSVDIDIFIGEVDYLGRGIGPRILKMLIKQLSEDPTIPLIGMSTSVNNQYAIKAYQKAGFRCLFQFDSPTYGRCWIMGLNPAIAVDS